MYAREQVELDHEGATEGVSRRAELEQVAKATGKTIRELAGHTADCPLDVMYLWETFQEINAGRSSNGMGPNPVSFLDMWAWCQLFGVPLSAWEVGVLKQLDSIWLEAYHNARSRRTNAQNRK